MKKISVFFFSILVTATILFAQDLLPYRLSEKDLEILLDRLEKTTDSFESSLDEALDDSRIDDSSREDNINAYIDAFEDATDRLESRFDGDQSAAADVEEVLNRAAAIDRFIIHHDLPDKVTEDWTRVRVLLDEIATAYDVSWGWMGVSDSAERMDDDEVEDLLERIEANADRFEQSLDDALDESDVDGSRLEDRINAYMKNFEQATDRLKDEYDEDEAAVGLVNDVLRQGAGIDRFVSLYVDDPEAEKRWSEVRTDLDQLARGYNFAWRWRTPRDLDD